MINFRYHVVSLTAVFLALAIGLVVGTAALNGPVADSLKDTVNALRKNNEQLRESYNSLTEEVKREEDFVSEAAPRLLTGTLPGRRVLVVGLPTGREHVDGVVERLRMGGATLTGRIAVQDKFVNPDNGFELLGLAARAAQPTIPNSGLPGNSDGVETSSALLASALLDRPGGGTAVNDVDRRAVLAEYGNAGYITVSDKITGSAEAVVIVTGQPYVDRDAAKKDQSVVRLVEQFHKTGVAVVAGSGSNGGNVVAVVRGDPALAKKISTIDNANTPAGQVVTALTLADQINLKKVGHYGLGAAAGSLLPKLPT